MTTKTEVVKAKKELTRTDSPAEMIREAVRGGADLDKLSKLLDLQERWEKNEAKKAYHFAMAKFKANPPEIAKDKKVAFANTKYNHASLANVVKKITKELSSHGLSASWRTHQNAQIVVTCLITHVLGHSEETTISAGPDTSGSKNSIQAIGSTITYLERYTLLAALGLATHEQDDDGQAAKPPKDMSPVEMPKKRGEPPAKSSSPAISSEQAKALDKAAINAGVGDKLFKLINEKLGISTYQELTKEQYEKAMVWVSKHTAGKVGRTSKDKTEPAAKLSKNNPLAEPWMDGNEKTEAGSNG